jgi:hypothetical protein
MDKHSSLLQKSINYGRKEFYSTGPSMKFISPRQQFSSLQMEQRALKNVNNCLNTNIFSYLDTYGGQSCNLYLNVGHFFNTCVNYASVSA